MARPKNVFVARVSDLARLAGLTNEEAGKCNRGKALAVEYTLEDLAGLAGVQQQAMYQYVSRGRVDPADLTSIVAWCARYGEETLREEIVSALFGDPPRKFDLADLRTVIIWLAGHGRDKVQSAIRDSVFGREFA